MKPDTVNYIINVILFGIIMLMIVSEWAFGWPTNQHLLYINIAWVLYMIISGFYVWYLESKDNI